MLLHYTIEVPSTGVCLLVERVWRHTSGHGPQVSWFYLVYFIVGGAFYSSLAAFLRRSPKQNATNVT
jgi:hypothetical protein